MRRSYRNQRSRADIVAVAQAAGVSASTVSRTFNHPDLVKLATRKRIERAVHELGYVRNRAAQAMHGRRSGTIGLVVPTVNNAIFSEVIQAFSDAVDAEGFTILIASHGFDLNREYDVTRKLMEHRVDGIALIGLDHLDATHALIEQQDVPAITIWNHSADARLPCIGVDNHDARTAAARHLIEIGHTEIGTIFPPTPENDRARARFDGAMATLAEAGLGVRDAWRLEARYNVQQAKDACGLLLASEQRPTALLCGNDVIAHGALYAAHRTGLDVPCDLLVIGIGDFPGSKEMEPGLTTVRLPVAGTDDIDVMDVSGTIPGGVSASAVSKSGL